MRPELEERSQDQGRYLVHHQGEQQPELHLRAEGGGPDFTRGLPGQDALPLPCQLPGHEPERRAGAGADSRPGGQV